MVFYRKYRPQKIDDLDSQAVRETLVSVLAKDPPHAFLFTGPKGLGKTSTARIIAKAINCTGHAVNKKQISSKSSGQSSEIIEPCNECEQCTSITNGTNMDILEIDAASNRGIDEIRDLKEKIRLSPLSARKKVYIIDEVHMLTTEAFNALLKTLEEPPDHAMFILATTEPQKVPATILSRCFHISYKKATETELVRSLRRIVKGEKIKVDDEALSYIAALSGGAFRDGTKILEEMALASKGKPLTKKFVQDLYNFESIDVNTLGLIKSLTLKNTKESLKIVKSLVEQGTDMKYFIAQVVGELHGMLLSKVGVGSESAAKDMMLEIDEIRQLIGLLTRAYDELKSAVLPHLPLELAIIEWTTSTSESTPAAINGTRTNVTEEEISVSSLRKQQGNIKKNNAMYGSTAAVKQGTSEDNASKINHTKVGLLHTLPNGEITKEWLDTFWSSIISEMKNHNHTIAGLLRGCVVKNYDKKSLIVETKYKFHKERLDDTAAREALAKACKMLTGKDVTVEVQLKK